jgi:hypothetical protein
MSDKEVAPALLARALEEIGRIADYDWDLRRYVDRGKPWELRKYPDDGGRSSRFRFERATEVVNELLKGAPGS